MDLNREELASAAEAVRSNICCYAGDPCDCKYGVEKRSSKDKPVVVVSMELFTNPTLLGLPLQQLGPIDYSFQHWILGEIYPYQKGERFSFDKLVDLTVEITTKGFDVMISHTDTHINLFIDSRSKRFRTR